ATSRRTAASAPDLGERPGARASALVEVVAQLLTADGVPQLRQGLGLDLADALAGDAELLADLLEGASLAVVEPETHAHDLLLAIGELVESLGDRLVEEGTGGGVGR